MKHSEYSAIIVGTGAAGLYAALKISQQISLPDGVLLITKSTLGESNSKYAQGGIVIAGLVYVLLSIYITASNGALFIRLSPGYFIS